MITNYLIEFTLTVWAAWSVRLINRQAKCALYSGILCNLCFLSWWVFTKQYGFLVGDFVFTAMYSRELYRSLNVSTTERSRS